MNEEFFTNIDQLTMHDPGVQLVEENFVALKQKPLKNIFDDWITC
jgi:hypothetical protein